MIVMKECEYQDLKAKAEKVEQIKVEKLNRERLNSALSRLMIGTALGITIVTQVIL